VAPPTLDDDSGLSERVEDFAVEQLVAKARVETLDVAVLPRTAPLDVSGLMKPAELSISQVALAPHYAQAVADTGTDLTVKSAIRHHTDRLR
jgi:hypothetical protein